MILHLPFRSSVPAVPVREPERMDISPLSRDRELRLNWTVEGARLAANWTFVEEGSGCHVDARTEN